jgi:hypothetical protein
VRAIGLGFLKFDGSVASEQLAVLDRTGAGTFAVGASVWLVDGASLFGCGRFAELPGNRSANVVGMLFDGGEIEVVEGFVGAEEIEGNRFEDLLEARVEVGLRR